MHIEYYIATWLFKITESILLDCPLLTAVNYRLSLCNTISIITRCSDTNEGLIQNYVLRQLLYQCRGFELIKLNIVEQLIPQLDLRIIGERHKKQE